MKLFVKVVLSFPVALMTSFHRYMYLRTCSFTGTPNKERSE
jgi:hypothetical protein